MGYINMANNISHHHQPIVSISAELLGSDSSQLVGSVMLGWAVSLLLAWRCWEVPRLVQWIN
jgi:hypothetical protein